MSARERLMEALDSRESGELRLLVHAMSAADPTLEADLELGAAWREAVAAVPEGWIGPDLGPASRPHRQRSGMAVVSLLAVLTSQPRTKRDLAESLGTTTREAA